MAAEYNPDEGGGYRIRQKYWLQKGLHPYSYYDGNRLNAITTPIAHAKLAILGVRRVGRSKAANYFAQNFLQKNAPGSTFEWVDFFSVEEAVQLKTDGYKIVCILKTSTAASHPVIQEFGDWDAMINNMGDVSHFFQELGRVAQEFGWKYNMNSDEMDAQ